MEGRRLAKSAKEPMPPEVQAIVLKVLFSGPARVSSGKGSGFMFVPGGVNHSNWELERHMVVAARVCKAWRAAYETHLMTQTSGIFKDVLRGVVDSALDLCDYDKYYDEMPERSKMAHYVYAARKPLFTMIFTRTQDGAMQRFDAVYGAGGKVAVRSIEFFKLSRELEAQALEQWLVEQHARFAGRESDGGRDR